MKLCKGCGNEYENFSTYCNECNLDLDEDNSVSKVKKLTDATKIALGIAKNNIIKSHQVLVFFQVIFLILISYIIFSRDQSLSNIMLVLIFSLFPVAHIIISRGIKDDKSWAHTASTIVGFLIILGFPIGTIIGFIILRNVFKKEWKLVELN